VLFSLRLILICFFIVINFVVHFFLLSDYLHVYKIKKAIGMGAYKSIRRHNVFLDYKGKRRLAGLAVSFLQQEVVETGCGCYGGVMHDEPFDFGYMGKKRLVGRGGFASVQYHVGRLLRGEL
jgi:hypothetical protein